jgi:hypothetical protein
MSVKNMRMKLKVFERRDIEDKRLKAQFILKNNGKD